jgi:hypothetical protein
VMVKAKCNLWISSLLMQCLLGRELGERLGYASRNWVNERTRAGRGDPVSPQSGAKKRKKT